MQYTRSTPKNQLYFHMINWFVNWYSQLIFTKATKITEWRERTVFLISGAGITGYPWKRVKLDPCIIPYTKINSIWTKDLTMRVNTIKLFEENTGENLHDLGFGNAFLDMRPNTWATEEKTGLHQSSKLLLIKGH